MPKKNLIKLLLILPILISLLSGCALTIPNLNLCRDRGLEGHCIETVSKKQTIIPEEEWPDKRYEMFHIDDKAWSKIKKFILKACSLKNVKCKKEKIEEMFADLEMLLLSPDQIETIRMYDEMLYHD